ncbi:MAG: FG-GAP repeat domain-containing protein, partial [Cypionkella sp.]
MMRAALLCLCALPASAQDIPRFADETASAGIAHSFAGEWEFMVGGGAAIFDCNADGLPDVYLAGGVNAAQMLVNTSAKGGALAFTPAPSGAEIDMVSGAYPINIDDDGIADLVILRVGENIIMRGLGNC